MTGALEHVPDDFKRFLGVKGSGLRALLAREMLEVG